MVILTFVPAVSGLYSDNSDTPHYVANINFTVCDTHRKCTSTNKEGKYGTRSSHTPIDGYLFHSNPTHGCEEFDFKVKRTPWIALISRGECSFTKKIENAINHNASAVIIYDNKPGRVLMGHETSNVVVVSITNDDGLELKTKLNDSSIYVQITFDKYVPDRKFNTISVLFVSVSFIVLMVISLAWLVFYYVQRFRYLYARDKTEVR